MRSGLFLIMPRAGGASIRDALAAALDDAVLAEGLGFDRVWVTEHHGTDFGVCTSPSVVAAAIAATRWTLQRMADLTGNDEAVAEAGVDDYLRERAFVGPPARVRDQVRALAATGATELLRWMRWGDLGDDLVRASMRRYRDLALSGPSPAVAQ